MIHTFQKKNGLEVKAITVPEEKVFGFRNVLMEEKFI